MADLRDRLQTTLGATYSIQRELGGGGMSRVFVAEESSLGRRVVVKVLPSDALSGVSLERFKREIALVAGLQHPHIVPLLAAGEVEGVPYFTMPLVEGESLRARLLRTGELPIADAVRLLREVASALAYAHRKGIVHRDIKPENILLTEEHAVVSDFGVAKALTAATESGEGAGGLTSVGIAVGTPAYMAPEQAAGDPATDHRADIYAFGVVAYELLTGRPPFEGRPQALIAAHATESPDAVAARRPAIPAALASLVMRCLAKRPADRPQRAEDLMRELDAVPSSSGDQYDVRVRTPRASRTKRLAPFVISLGLIAVGGYAVWSFANRASDTASGRPTIAVRPMVNHGDPADEPFSDGLTDELISALGNVEQISVTGSSSVFALKDKPLSLRAFANRLHVANVLESSLRRSGDRVKISIQLLSAADDHVVWSKTFDRKAEDVLAVQEEIAQAVVRELRVRLGAATGPLVRQGTADVEAYSLFLRGKHYVGRYAPVDLRQAIDFFTKAIERDSNYALAYAWRGSAHTLLTVFGSAPASEQMPRARADVEKALLLDSALADAHVYLSEIIGIESRGADSGSKKELLRALKLDPRNARAQFFYAGSLLADKRPDDARTQLRIALETDPLASNVLMRIATTYFPAGQPDGTVLPAGRDSAVRYLREALDYTPTFSYARELLAHCYLAQRKPVEAVAEFEEAARNGTATDSAHLAYGYAVTNRRPEAEFILQSLVAAAKTRYMSAANIALAYVGLHDNDEAFRWLKRGWDEHDPQMTNVYILPAFAPLLGDARFGALTRQSGPKR